MKLAASARILLAAALFACLPLAAHAAVINLVGAISPPQGVNSKGSGSMTGTLDTATNKFTWHIIYYDLSGPATAAHFHGPAAPGANAAPQLPLKGDIESPINGSATLTPAQAKDLLNGMWYLNVHTKAYPAGEVRAQIRKQE